MTKQEFVNAAVCPTMLVGGTKVNGKAKQYSTGSVGFNFNGKIAIPLPDGSIGLFQVNGNCTLIGSKDLPESVAPPVPEPSPDLAEEAA